MKIRLQGHKRTPANPKLAAYLCKYKKTVIIRSLEQVRFSDPCELRAKEDIWIWRLIPTLNAGMKIITDVDMYPPQKRKELIDSIISNEDDDELLNHNNHEYMYHNNKIKRIDKNKIIREKALNLRALYKQGDHPKEITTFIDETLNLLGLASWDMESEVFVQNANKCAINYTLNLDELERERLIQLCKPRIRLKVHEFGTRTSSQMIPIVFQRFLGVNVKKDMSQKKSRDVYFMISTSHLPQLYD